MHYFSNKNDLRSFKENCGLNKKMSSLLIE